MDPEHSRILAANDAGCELLGYTRDELLETPISRIHPSELAELSELLESVLRNGRASTIKLTCRTKQGTFLPDRDLAARARARRPARILGLVQDRSEHRQRVRLSSDAPRLSGHTAANAAPSGHVNDPRREENIVTAGTSPYTERADASVSSAARNASAPTSAASSSPTRPSPLLVWEKPYYPTYYFPAADVPELSPRWGVIHSPSRGEAVRRHRRRAGACTRRRLRYEQSSFEELRDAIPVEPDCVAQLLERRLLVPKSGAGCFPAAGGDGEGSSVSTARRVNDAAVGGKELRSDVGGREVVGRVVRLLPDEERVRRVGDELAAEVCPDAFRSALDADASARCRRMGGSGSHDALLVPWVVHVPDGRIGS